MTWLDREESALGIVEKIVLSGDVSESPTLIKPVPVLRVYDSLQFCFMLQHFEGSVKHCPTLPASPIEFKRKKKKFSTTGDP